MTLTQWSRNDQSAPEARWSEFDQKERIQERPPLTAEGLLVRLLLALNDRDGAYLLWYLLAQHADISPLRSSRRVIHGDLGGAVGLTNVLAATNRLVDAGFVSIRVYPKTFTEYRVDANRVAYLLEEYEPSANFLPGIRPKEVPFLLRWNNGDAFTEVPAAAKVVRNDDPAAAHSDKRTTSGDST